VDEDEDEDEDDFARYVSPSSSKRKPARPPKRANVKKRDRDRNRAVRLEETTSLGTFEC
jgi:hypothetical protein